MWCFGEGVGEEDVSGQVTGAAPSSDSSPGVAPGRRLAVLPAGSVVDLIIGLDSDVLF